MVKTKKRIKGGQESTTVEVKNPDVSHTSSMKDVPNPAKTTATSAPTASLPSSASSANGVPNPSYTVNKNTLGKTSSHHFYQPLIDYKYQIIISILVVIVGYLLYSYVTTETEGDDKDKGKDKDKDKDDKDDDDDASGADKDDDDDDDDDDASGADEEGAGASGEDEEGADKEGYENYKQNYKQNKWIEGRPDLTSNNPFHLLPGYQK